MHSMSSYGDPGASFTRNVSLFESDWRTDLSDIQGRIQTYDSRTRIPAIERLQVEISELEEKIVVA